MAAFATERVLAVRHFTDRLFAFTTTRDPSFRFENGQFAMIGLMVEGKPLLRAYSMASANYEETLEFFSIKVPDGPLTSRLQHLQVGDNLIVARKATGTLLATNLLPGRRLYLFATGTGLAPFLSIVRDPSIYEAFETVVVLHGTRLLAEQAYAGFFADELPEHPLVGEAARAQVRYYGAVTREPHEHRGRLTDFVVSGRLADDLDLPPLDPAEDRVMVCGSEALLKDMVVILKDRGFVEGASNSAGSYVIEKAFVEK